MESGQCKIYKIMPNNETTPENETNYLVFNMKHANYLREKRLSGRFIGSVLSTQQVANSSEIDKKSGNYLPFKLTDLEVGIVIENFIEANDCELRILKTGELNQDQLEIFKEKFQEYNDRLLETKNSEYINLRKAQLVSMRDKIIGAKRKKLNDQLQIVNDNEEKIKIQSQIDNLDANFDEELNNLETNLKKENIKKYMAKENTNTEIFMQSPEFYKYLFSSQEISSSELQLHVSVLNKTCKYNAFKYLWNQGYYITCGAKFGGEFLVYPGPPSQYHSQFILNCTEESRSFTFKELVAFSRMATTVKKTYVIAMLVDKMPFYKENKTQRIGDKVLILNSINWAHF